MDLKKLIKHLNWDSYLSNEKMTEEEIRENYQALKNNFLLPSLLTKQKVSADFFMEIFNDLSPKVIYDALDFQKYDFEKEESLHLFLKLHGYETEERGVILSKGKWNIQVNRPSQQRIIILDFDDEKAFNSIVGKGVKLTAMFLRGNSWYGNIVAIFPLIERYDHSDEYTIWIPDPDNFINSLHKYFNEYSLMRCEIGALTRNKPEREKLIDRLFSVKDDSDLSEKEKADLAIIVEAAINSKFVSASEFSEKLRKVCELIEEKE